MGVFLSIFDKNDEEIAGVDFGSRDGCTAFLNYVAHTLESGVRASRFPTLVRHLQENEDWDPFECAQLRQELETIRQELQKLPEGDRDEESARSEMLSMVDDLLRLAKQAFARQLPIQFQ